MGEDANQKVPDEQAASVRAHEKSNAVEPGSIDGPEASATEKETVRATTYGLFEGPWYYSARYLHRHVTALHPIEPKVPSGTGDIRGRVSMVLKVSPQGEVDSYEILESEPPGLFDQFVVDAFASERYAPGLIAGAPVRGQLHVEVMFEPGESPRTVVDFGLHK